MEIAKSQVNTANSCFKFFGLGKGLFGDWGKRELYSEYILNVTETTGRIYDFSSVGMKLSPESHKAIFSNIWN